jgi:GNAT superfamily N-acetyltransferase
VRTRVIDGVVCLATTRIAIPFLNRALGFGTMADATPRLLDRIERHYERLERTPRLAIATGCVAASTLRLLERRGYRAMDEDPELIYCYDGRSLPRMPTIDGLRIDPVSAGDARLYARTAFDSFRDRGPRFVGIIEMIIRKRRRARGFLGRVDGELAATGIYFDIAPVGGLGNGSVLKRFRGRGIQKAMIVRRMQHGWERGRRIFFGQTQNPASAHNLDDLGWHKLYDEITWERR